MINANASPQPDVPTPTTIDPNSTPSTVASHDTEELRQREKLHLTQLYFVKSVAMLLIIQGLWSLFNSIRFIFFELPTLEQQLHLGQISSFQINTFANKAIIMTISTILSLFLIE